MPQSLSMLYVHLVFSTKERQCFFRSPEFRGEMHTYIAGVSRQLDCQAIIVGGMEDHVHILARLGRGISQADWVKEVKRVSSTWIKENGQCGNDFSWQTGYGIFSVSASNVDSVRNYIATQDEHHRESSFQDEFRALLRKHGIELDERYVWD